MFDLVMKVNTSVTVPVNGFPLIDDTDFKSRETAITYNQAGMDLVWNFVTPAGVQTQTAVTPTTGGDYDWVNKGDGIYNIEIPASSGASINNNTIGYGWFTGICTGVLAWKGPIIAFLPTNIVDSLINGSSFLKTDLRLLSGSSQSLGDLKDFSDIGYDPTTHRTNADAVAISGDSVAADNLELQFDGTGLSGDNYPAIQSQTTSILSGTTEIQTELANGGRTDLLIDSIITHLTDIKGAGWVNDTLVSINQLIYSLILAADGRFNDIDTDNASIIGYVDELETRLSAIRAGYLDNLSSGSVALETTVQAIKTQSDKLNFTGNDVKATLDSEEVDIGSVKSVAVTSVDNFKADVSSLALEANIESHLSGVISAYDPPTRTELTSDKDEILLEVNNNETKIDVITTRLTSARAGYLDNLSLGAVALSSDISTLLTRISALRAGYLDNLSAGAVALEGTLTAIKGAGWSTETLKAIKTAVDNITGGGDATLSNQSDIIDKLKGIMSKTYTLLTAVGNFTPTTDSLEAILDTGNVNWLTGGGVGGSSTVTITIEDDEAKSVPDASVQIWNTNLDQVISYGITNSNGVVELTADDDDYQIKVRKAGYSFDATTAITVSSDTTKTITGSAISIAEPEDGTVCKVYEYCYKLDGATPLERVTAKANITVLPYKTGGVSYSGKEEEGTYDPDTGIVYWEIIMGATVEFIIKECGIRKTKVVPSTPTALLSNL